MGELPYHKGKGCSECSGGDQWCNDGLCGKYNIKAYSFKLLKCLIKT